MKRVSVWRSRERDVSDFEVVGCRGDERFVSIPKLLRLAVDKYGDSTFIEEGNQRLSFRRTLENVEQACASFIQLGVVPGDRVAIWAPNRADWIIAALAAQCAGAALVPINTRYKGQEAADILRRSRAKVLLTVGQFLGSDYLGMLEHTEPLPKLTCRVLLEGEAHDAMSWVDFLSLGQGIEPGLVAGRMEAVSGDAICDILFTSGTTGSPKGVLCTHAQTLRVFRDWCEVVGLRSGDRYLIAMPFFHAFGYKAGWLACLMMGATVLPEPIFDAERLLRRIGRDRVSVLPGPPALYQSILARQDLHQFDLSPLRLAVTGAAVIPQRLIEEMQQRLGFETVITGYGLTETTGVATMCREGDDASVIASTSGRALPGMELIIERSDGSRAEVGEAGEIMLRGYNVMVAYLDDPAATESSINSQGFLHTGDIGSLDAAGNLRITDRKKDMVIVGGFNVYPAEVERLLCCHSAIAQAAVIGCPDDRLGEVCHAFLVLRDGAELEVDTLPAWCRERIANFKVPRHFSIQESLPMNASGKTQKYKLR